MVEQMLKARLTHLLKKLIRRQAAGRLFTWMLFNAILFLLLLCGLLLFDLSILALNLIQFIILSLFPLFLLLPDGRELQRMKQAIRALDVHCLLESYLESAGPEQRRLMEPGVIRLLEKAANRAPARRSRAEISKPHQLLLGGLLISFLLFQASSLIRFKALSPSLSPQTLRSRVITSAQPGAEEQISETYEPGAREISGLADPLEWGIQSAGTGLAGQQAPERFPGDEVPGDWRPGSQQRADRQGLGGALEDSVENSIEESAEQSAEQRGEQMRDEQGAAVSQTGRGPEGDFLDPFQPDPENAEGIVPEIKSTPGTAGTSFLESPLGDYTPLPERVFSRGGERLGPGPLLREAEDRPGFNRAFGDFAGPIAVEGVFDPRLARIREHYLDLIHEYY